MQQIIILASSLWVAPTQKECDYFENSYLKLANYMLAEKLADREVRAIWFCSSPVVNETILKFSSDYVLNLEFITLNPSDEMTHQSQYKQLELSEKEQTEGELARLENDFWKESFPTEIDLYINTHFSSALEIMAPSALASLPVWFTANFSQKAPLGNLEEKEFIEPYIELLPFDFRVKARSLLATCFDDIEESETWGITNKYKVSLLCFAKLLHGFVCASGDGFNDFSASDTANSLDIDDLYLGGILSYDMFKELSLSDYEAEDSFELRVDFLESIASEQVGALVTTLTKNFGVTELCAMLWWCLYPNNTQSVYDKFDNLFNRIDFYFLPELMQVYNLLEDGWSDYADNN